MLGNARRTVLTVSLLLASILAFPPAAVAQQKPPDPAVREGVALHDKGEFDKAIEKFEEALKRDPNDMVALYEMANTYWAKKDYKKVLELGARGLQSSKGCQSGDFYMVIANAQDEVGEGDAAIETFKAGIRECPTQGALHYNLAIAYINKNQIDLAREALKRDVTLRPTHSSGHFYLARIYEAQGYKVPAVLAYGWFLILEPDTARSKAALASLDRLFKMGYDKNPSTGQVTLTVSAIAKKDEGDFGAAELTMLVAEAVPEVQDRVSGAPDSVVKKLQAVLMLLGRMKETGPGFASEFYLPYYAGLVEHSHVEAFAHAVMFAGGQPEVKDWIAKNQPALKALVTWSKAFPWPSPKL